ncbi:10593_t:CDS:2 [Paraglomus occultum]|uniref:10593_t:CDS:1 n=1 Tax=Paraglomus occultum TaxID=144539 RepID=A0A9N9GKF0_9GLOM|nr:10593_t:CDS:2 [Paraglomus occultum]
MRITDDDGTIDNAVTDLLDTPLPDGRQLIDCMSTALMLLRDCERLTPDDDVIKQSIESIKREKTNFQDLCHKSLRHSMKLADHADDAAIYFQCILELEGGFPQSFLEAFNNLLENALSLRNEAKELKTGYRSIVEKFQEIKQNLEECQEQLECCEKLVHESNRFLTAQLTDANKKQEKTRENVNAFFEKALLLIAPVMSWEVLITLPLVKPCLLKLVDAFTVGDAMKIKRLLEPIHSGISRLGKDQNDLKLLIVNLCDINYQIQMFETFWSAQVTALEEVIRRLQRLPQTSQRLQLFPPTVAALGSKYTELKEDCMKYSKSCQLVLDKDALAAN